MTTDDARAALDAVLPCTHNCGVPDHIVSCPARYRAAVWPIIEGLVKDRDEALSRLAYLEGQDSEEAAAWEKRYDQEHAKLVAAEALPEVKKAAEWLRSCTPGELAEARFYADVRARRLSDQARRRRGRAGQTF